MTRGWRHALWAPWAGLFGGFAAWAAHHQVGSNLVYLSCAAEDRTLVVAFGAACAFAAIAAGWLSWLSRSAEAAGPTQETRRFLAWVSMAGAALFTFAILLQTTAGLTVPVCAP